jgi:hypothetical protein
MASRRKNKKRTPSKKILTVEVINYTKRTHRVIHLDDEPPTNKNDENGDDLNEKTPIYVDEGTKQSKK